MPTSPIMIAIKRFKFEEKNYSKLAFELRSKVFVEEQQVDPVLEYDGQDELAQHYLVLSDDKAIGTARWRQTEMGVKLERFAILHDYRNIGIGSKLLKEVINDVLKLKKPVYLHSQLRAVPYYERHGFKKQGDVFTEAGIKHYLMIYS